jgi:hypothetical protein
LPDPPPFPALETSAETAVHSASIARCLYPPLRVLRDLCSRFPARPCGLPAEGCLVPLGCGFITSNDEDEDEDDETRKVPNPAFPPSRLPNLTFIPSCFPESLECQEPDGAGSLPFFYATAPASSSSVNTFLRPVRVLRKAIWYQSSMRSGRYVAFPTRIESCLITRLITRS